MPSDLPEHNDVIGLLREIHREQTRQGKSIEELNVHITGGPDPARGLAFRTTQLEAEKEAREARDQKRDAWIAGIGITVASAMVLMVLPKLFQLLSTAPQ